MPDIDFLTEQDEEFQMLREWTRRLGDEINYAWKTSGKKLRSINGTSHLITQSIIREHLLKHGLNVSQKGKVVAVSPDGKVHQAVHLLILKEGENPDEDNYSDNKEHIVLEIRTTAVADAVERTKKRFAKIENLVKDFAVVVLSERHDYPCRYKPENTRNLFTLVIREKDFLRPINRPNVDMTAELETMLRNHELRKTGKWQELANIQR
jgi:hypothetical protein